MQAITLASAALLAGAPIVRAMGQAAIQNQCDFDVYMWVVSSSEGAAEPVTISSGGGFWSHTYKSVSEGGMSLKIATDSSSTTVTQFEYTLADSIYYDISNINCNSRGCPFVKHGLSLNSSDSACPSVACPAGQAPCNEAYNVPNDVRTLACTPSSDLTLTLCGSSMGSDSSSDFGSDSGSNSGSGSTSSSDSSSPAPSSGQEASSNSPTPTTMVTSYAPSSAGPAQTSMTTTEPQTSVTTSNAQPANVHEDSSGGHAVVVPHGGGPARVVVTEYATEIEYTTTTTHVGGWGGHRHGGHTARAEPRNVHHPHARPF